MNPDFATNIVQRKDISLLRDIEAGDVRWKDGLAILLRRGLLEYRGLHAVQLTGRGLWALRGVIEGGLVVVSPTYKLESLRGCAGMVERIQTHMVDADRLDQWGYLEKHATPHTSVSVRLAG